MGRGDFLRIFDIKDPIKENLLRNNAISKVLTSSVNILEKLYGFEVTLNRNNEWVIQNVYQQYLL